MAEFVAGSSVEVEFDGAEVSAAEAPINPNPEELGVEEVAAALSTEFELPLVSAAAPLPMKPNPDTFALSLEDSVSV